VGNLPAGSFTCRRAGWLNPLSAFGGLNGFLTLNDRDILTNAGSISHTSAKENAEREHEKFKASEQKMIIEGDFEKAVKKIEHKKKK
jgi:hypothetical protein